MDWVSRAEEMLYDGESIRETIYVRSGAIIVTSHRVLTFTPDRDGPNYRHVDRPNVDGAEVSTKGNMGFLKHAVKALVVGGMLLAAGLTINFDGLASGVSLDSGTATGQVGVGGMMGPLQSTLSLLAQLDELLLTFGGLAVVLGIIVLGVYIWTRERLLVILIAGADDIELTAPDEESSVQRLQDALRTPTVRTGPRPP
jgi:hypothetical protein